MRSLVSSVLHADLDLKILPDRDANGKEMAELSVTLKGGVTEHIRRMGWPGCI